MLGWAEIGQDCKWKEVTFGNSSKRCVIPEWTSALCCVLQAKGQFKKQSVANNVEVRVPVPSDADSPKFKTSTGSAKYVPEKNLVIWTIKSFPVSPIIHLDRYSRYVSTSELRHFWCSLLWGHDITMQSWCEKCWAKLDGVTLVPGRKGVLEEGSLWAPKCGEQWDGGQATHHSQLWDPLLHSVRDTGVFASLG